MKPSEWHWRGAAVVLILRLANMAVEALITSFSVCREISFHFFINLKYYQGVVYQCIESSLAEWAVLSCKYWLEPIPGRERSASVGPVLGITSVFPLVWAHLGLKLVEFVGKKSIPDVLVNILMRFRWLDSCVDELSRISLSRGTWSGITHKKLESEELHEVEVTCAGI